MFVLRNPRVLKVPIQMRDYPKIFELQKEIVNFARNTLERVKTQWCPYYAQKYMTEA